jgi:hypothetical protein
LKLGEVLLSLCFELKINCATIFSIITEESLTKGDLLPLELEIKRFIDLIAINKPRFEKAHDREYITQLPPSGCGSTPNVSEQALNSQPPLQLANA